MIINTKETRKFTELQAADLAADGLRAEAEALDGEKADKEKLFAAEQIRLSGPKDRLGAIDREIRERESETRENQAGLEKLQASTYMIKDQAAYEKMLSSIKSSKEKKDRLENETLELLEKKDAAEEEVKKAEAELMSVKERYQEEKKAFSELYLLKTEQIRQQELKRKNLSDSIQDKELLEKYERLRNKKKGLIVAETKTDGSGHFFCSGCNMTLTTQQSSEIRKRDVFVVCDCGCLLYLKENVYG